MKASKRLGIWMDHSTAHLMEFTSDPIQTKSIESTFTHLEKEKTLSKSEHIMHNKEQHQHAEYYKKLGEEISHFDEVIFKNKNLTTNFKKLRRIFSKQLHRNCLDCFYIVSDIFSNKAVSPG